MRTRPRLTHLRLAAFIVAMMTLLAACSGGVGGSGTEDPTDADQTAADDGTEPAATEGDDVEASGTSCGEPTDDPVGLTVATASPAAPIWAHIWIAEPLGYYDQEGLDVEIIGQLTGGTVEQSVASGSLDFGAATQDTMIPSAAELDPLPVQFFLHDTLWVDLLLVLDESEAQTGEDLVGGTIGIPEAKDEAVAALLMSAAGVEPGDYETLVVGARAPAAVAMDRGEIDAFAGTFVDQFAMGAADFDVRVIDTGDTATLINSGLIAPREMIQDDPELVACWGRAVAKGMIWQYENPDAALDLLEQIVPEAVEDREAAELLINATIERNRPMYEARGRVDEARWQDTVDLYVTLGQLEESYDADELFTNDLIDQIWDFDVEAVQEAARNDERPTG